MSIIKYASLKLRLARKKSKQALFCIISVYKIYESYAYYAFIADEQTKF